MPNLPQATQTYNPKLAPQNRVVRRAKCPEHDKPSTEFMGTNSTSWVFRCTALTTKQQRADHTFAARPDPHAPHSADETVVWIAKQLATWHT